MHLALPICIRHPVTRSMHRRSTGGRRRRRRQRTLVLVRVAAWRPRAWRAQAHLVNWWCTWSGGLARLDG